MLNRSKFSLKRAFLKPLLEAMAGLAKLPEKVAFEPSKEAKAVAAELAEEESLKDALCPANPVYSFCCQSTWSLLWEKCEQYVSFRLA